jgi:hypothetical protein
MTKFCRNGIRFFSRNIQKRARQYLTMQILVQTHIHTEHWFYRHIHKKSPLSCANKRNLSGPNLKVSSNRLHILGSLVSQRSQKKIEKENVPTLAFLLSRKINKKDQVSTRKNGSFVECVTWKLIFRKKKERLLCFTDAKWEKKNTSTSFVLLNEEYKRAGGQWEYR